jgi:hypothetical protein
MTTGAACENPPDPVLTQKLKWKLWAKSFRSEKGTETQLFSTGSLGK